MTAECPFSQCDICRREAVATPFAEALRRMERQMSLVSSLFPPSLGPRDS